MHCEGDCRRKCRPTGRAIAETQIESSLAFLPGASNELVSRKFCEGIGAVADAVFFVRADFSERLLAALGNEDRIVAEAAIPTRRPDEGAVDSAFVDGVFAIRPREGEHTREPCVPGSARPL